MAVQEHGRSDIERTQTLIVLNSEEMEMELYITHGTHEFPLFSLSQAASITGRCQIPSHLLIPLSQRGSAMCRIQIHGCVWAICMDHCCW